ncbi:hypothetical protein VF14_09805 [Nostoc linckia z18]|jgi:hypothetical protein|uniref:Bacteriocin n=2 Tax=Nostoc linckia TaxID=92942 RepID=A0A9Q5ZBR8_NOSLI|nr:CTB family bacteriocin [Nostoc linckia]PHK41732.1 hypothetical protein VF12_05510 [Nostoc linckia z15]PHK47125.1 hypothetical protein VF13_07080 [Nostoc linckia z16]PHJ66448.1 hypothetical protein VF02_07630 [Nostoc linckia z1]PHJ71323.1 hypothetical protein VF05_07490 [Nostoc linckia z3]PHJ75355.1 hypothetical protein VF03_10530 [Nostoc linckia z2]
MSQVLFTELSNEQLEVVAGGTDFQIDANFYSADQNFVSGESSSDANHSDDSSNGNSTGITTAGIAFLTLDADEILEISKQYGY